MNERLQKRIKRWGVDEQIKAHVNLSRVMKKTGMNRDAPEVKEAMDNLIRIQDKFIAILVNSIQEGIITMNESDQIIFDTQTFVESQWILQIESESISHD